MSPCLVDIGGKSAWFTDSHHCMELMVTHSTANLVGYRSKFSQSISFSVTMAPCGSPWYEPSVGRFWHIYHMLMISNSLNGWEQWKEQHIKVMACNARYGAMSIDNFSKLLLWLLFGSIFFNKYFNLFSLLVLLLISNSLGNELLCPSFISLFLYAYEMLIFLRKRSKKIKVWDWETSNSFRDHLNQFFNLFTIYAIQF